jgi:hypothetical protein
MKSANGWPLMLRQKLSEMSGAEEPGELEIDNTQNHTKAEEAVAKTQSGGRVLIVVSAIRQKNVRQKNGISYFSVLHFSV